MAIDCNVEEKLSVDVAFLLLKLLKPKKGVKHKFFTHPPYSGLEF